MSCDSAFGKHKARTSQITVIPSDYNTKRERFFVRIIFIFFRLFFQCYSIFSSYSKFVSTHKVLLQQASLQYYLTMAQFAKATFSAVSYATFRPSYPQPLYDTVLAYHEGPKHLCVDLGSGHGLVARALSHSFAQVIGTDPSPGMIEQAEALTSEVDHPNVSFHRSAAENLPFLKNESVDVIVSGQAAHWFDVTRLWLEMKRIVRNNGTLAFWVYKDHVFTDFPNASRILNDYAYGRSKDMLGPYWSQPGRDRVQNKLRDLKPPESDWTNVQRVEYEPGTKGPRTGEGTMFLNRKMSIGNCCKYIRTWSSFSLWQEVHPDKKSKDAGGEGDVVDEMFEAMRNAEPEWQVEDWLEIEVDMEWGSGLLLARRQWPGS